MDHKDFRILGLAGSLRRASVHRGLVRTAHEVAPEWMSCEGFDLARVPYFNQDVEDQGNPEPVTELREKIRAYDAVLIATARILPSLPLHEWEDTKETLHRYCQIVGKVKMGLSPFRNHWWHVTLHGTTHGLSTGPIPYGNTTFDISFDLLENRLEVTTGEGSTFAFALDDLPVAEFYRRVFGGLKLLGIDASTNPKPFDLDDQQTLENT